MLLVTFVQDSLRALYLIWDIREHWPFLTKGHETKVKEKEEGKELNLFEYWLAAVLLMDKIQQKPKHRIVQYKKFIRENYECHSHCFLKVTLYKYYPYLTNKTWDP